MTDRQNYYKNYYQNNKDKYKNEYRTIRYCEICEKEFVNITRHRSTDLHKKLVKKLEVDENNAYHKVRQERLSTTEPTVAEVPSLMLDLINGLAPVLSSG